MNILFVDCKCNLSPCFSSELTLLLMHKIMMFACLLMLQEQLRLEMEAEVNKSGRVSLIDLSDIIGVDLYHVEKQAQQLVADSVGLMLIQGEIISQTYWDTVAEDINERLQECSQIALAELAAQLHISSELAVTILVPRLGTLVSHFITVAIP